MKKLFAALVLAVLVLVLLPSPIAQADSSKRSSCWGQATAVFARTGEMGKHASQEPTPRLGLRNLARALYKAGEIPEDSLQALGVFVAAAEGLSIEACGTDD